jgi:hypothetical protein
MKFLQIILCLTLLFFSACKVENITGMYRTKGAVGGQAFIEINNDSTFIYKYHVGVASSKTIGKWKKDREFLILNSDQQPPADTLENFRILKQFKTESDSISIKLHYPDSSIKFNGMYALYKDGKLKNSDMIWNGDCNLNFPKIDFDSIYISPFYGYKSIILNSNIKNNIEILLTEIPNFGYEYFTNKAMKVRKRKLINKSGNIYYSAREFRKVK